jgi:predicted  nucleic acid-binding Zn-ribbon protein
MFACMECGRRFRTVTAAERAADRGCPNCGGVDIDVVADLPTRPIVRSVPLTIDAAVTTIDPTIR